MTATKTPQRPLLELAREAMPGLADAEVALGKVRQAMAAAREQVQPDAELHEQVLEQVLAGGPVPDDLGQLLAERRQHNQAVLLQVDLLQQVEAGVHQHRRSSTGREADLGLDVLADQLADLLAEARPVVAKLAGITSAEAAIDAGHPGPWAAQRRLAARLAELRDAQALLVSEALFPPDDARRRGGVVKPEARRLVDSHGTVRNFAELFPAGLPDKARTVAGSGVAIRDGRIVETSIVDTPVDVPPWLTGDPVDALRYLAGPDAQPWVPSLAELTAARDAATTTASDGSASLQIGLARERTVTRRLPPVADAPVGAGSGLNGGQPW